MQVWYIWYIAEEEINNILFECELHKKWTNLLYLELSDSGVFPFNAEHLLKISVNIMRKYVMLCRNTY